MFRGGSPASGIAAFTGGNTPFSILQGGIALVKTPSGTMGNNGAFTSGTALPFTFAEGAYFWFTANQIAAGVAAGLYWGIGSSTTAIQLYNATYSTGLPATGVQTPFVTTGPGATTGDTTTVTMLSFTAPALSINGRLEYELLWTTNSSAGNKTLSPRLGSTNITTTTVTTQTSVLTHAFMQNCGRTDKQVVGFSTNMSVGSGGSGGQLGIDTSVLQTATVLMAVPTAATDFAILNNYAFRVLAP